ncbi:NAD(P)-dependent oxidoreductase [Altererythrobacter arenosus]|uniref:NAD(P)-dependent oxidoreductase n=1 Tax=Altererythrobacter arenosus TaxID=3032592 RepID=A0ABY8G023_9SPHN|nr:NAD(P)-dependent oxidoreductase [Altererythrobacter sp. CAU 1644]WFL78966.1 NAD(P)-dependent oxidoreductase [Altererythrobacter sp. CAU 1644]
MSQPLPLTEMNLAGQHLRFVHAQNALAIPPDAVVYLATAVDPVDEKVIGAFPETIGLIANLGVGYDNIDLAAAARRDLLVSNTPVVTQDTADLAFALILAAARRVGEGERFLRRGDWGSVPLPPLGTRVHGATLGIVGFGAIGQAIARRATGFGMTILYHSRSEIPEAAKDLGAMYRADLLAMLPECDIVSINAPLTPETRHLIDARALSSCKHGAILVNTARGELVDEEALIAALRSRQIAAAGLDVFDGEPRVQRELLEMEQVVLTPHIGSATAHCRSDIIQRGLGNIASFLAEGTVIDPVLQPRAFS